MRADRQMDGQMDRQMDRQAENKRAPPIFVSGALITENLKVCKQVLYRLGKGR